MLVHFSSYSANNAYEEIGKKALFLFNNEHAILLMLKT